MYLILAGAFDASDKPNVISLKCRIIFLMIKTFLSLLVKFCMIAVTKKALIASRLQQSTSKHFPLRHQRHYSKLILIQIKYPVGTYMYPENLILHFFAAVRSSKILYTICSLNEIASLRQIC